MFGKRKITQDELEVLEKNLNQGYELLNDFLSKKDMFSSDFEQVKGAQNQMEIDIKQAASNIESVAEYAKNNSKTIATLSHSVDECKNKMKKAEQDYEELCSKICVQSEECIKIVEENKHFTSPSKYLSDLPSELRMQNQGYKSELTYMAEYGKQMGVMALNAAIEAGRLGDNGRQFVQSAEEIRALSRKYEESARTMLNRVEASEEKVKQLEDTVHHLVGLLKENNVAMTKLMRESEKTRKMVENSSMVSFSEEMAPIREELTGIKNAEEEIIKSEERNRMQMDDLLEEIVRQQDTEKELVRAMEDTFQSFAEYVKKV